MADLAADSDTTLVMTRTFDAPREKVFDAWLDAAQIPKWMGPRGVTADADRLEPKVGGSYRIVMHTPDGTPAVGGVYKEISRPEKLIFTWAWEAAHNAPPGGTAAHSGKGAQSGPGHETLVTVTFRDVGGGKTEMTLLHERFANAEARDSHRHGWTGSFDKLAEFLGA